MRDLHFCNIQQFQVLNMNRIIELQRKSSELTSDIEDILHAASLNFKAICSEVQQQQINTLHQQFAYLRNLLSQIQKTVQERAPSFMSYLIIKQIQDQQGLVRRQRLSQYEEKIYDQKRIITDKQTFFEQLLRPKRKRPAHQTAEEFQQIRAKEKETEEKSKNEQLYKEITELHAMKKLLTQQQKMRKKLELQHTKSSSISQVNVGEMPQIATERIVPFEDRKDKENRPTHARATSMQVELNKQMSSHFKKEDTDDNLTTANSILSEIKTFRAKNEQLHNIYDQASTSLKFKRNQLLKAQQLYKDKAKELKDVRGELIEIQKSELWKFNRVSRPVKIRNSSLNK